jgi:hypothetical protein
MDIPFSINVGSGAQLFLQSVTTWRYIVEPVGYWRNNTNSGHWKLDGHLLRFADRMQKMSVKNRFSARNFFVDGVVLEKVCS